MCVGVAGRHQRRTEVEVHDVEAAQLSEHERPATTLARERSRTSREEHLVGLVAVRWLFERERVTIEPELAFALGEPRRVAADERRAMQDSQRMHP